MIRPASLIRMPGLVVLGGGGVGGLGFWTVWSLALGIIAAPADMANLLLQAL